MKFQKVLLILAIPFLFMGIASSCSDTDEQVTYTAEAVQFEETLMTDDYQFDFIQVADIQYDVEYQLTQSPIDEDELNEGADNVIDTILKYVVGLLAVLDIILRFIPANSDNTIIGNIIKVLKFISDRLNRFKK